MTLLPKLRAAVLARSAPVVVLFLALTPRTARATEIRFTGDDVRVTVDSAGRARVEHALAYRVAGGPLKGFDITGVEPEAVIDPVAPVAADGEVRNAARVERKGQTALHVAMDPAQKPEKGHITLVVRVGYTVDMAAARELVSDGAMWRLAWVAPAAPEGYDAARVVFDLPAAPTEPLAIAQDGTVSDDGRVVTLRRGVERDELEMARPHVARGEAAAWTARVDPRAFPSVDDPSLRPPPEPPPPHAPGTVWGAALAIALACGIAFGFAVAVKCRRFASACAARGLKAEALARPLPAWARALGSGFCVAVAVAFEQQDLPAWGAAFIAFAMLLAAHRAPASPVVPRGPGQWLALAPKDAFPDTRESDLLDIATRRGKAMFAAVMTIAVALGLALRPLDPGWAWLVPLDALGFLAIFLTGSRAQLPPDRATAPGPRLASLHRIFKRDETLRVAPWARMPLGATAPDELRLLVMPRASMDGVVGIEVGVAWVATPAGYAPETEVLVRVREASSAAARMTTLAPGRRPVHGRKPDERVVRLVPALGSRVGAVALVKRLARELRDRRKAAARAAWGGTDRRLPANERMSGRPGAIGVPAAVQPA